jgi:cytochrome c oxidase assembly factor CtaG
MLSAELWNLNSPVWVVAAVMMINYMLLFRPINATRMLALLSAIALIVLVFISPVGVLADGYLFSAHMVQHLVLLLLVPLLILISLPSERFQRLQTSGILRGNATPIIGWICGIGAMWLWHIPSLCSAATESTGIGLLRDASLVVAGLAFWWPVFAPVKEQRLDPLAGIVYLFSACLGCTLLGVYITFTTVSVCPAFANPTDRINIVGRLYDLGLTPTVDQHLGGLLMWVPPCMLYLSVIVALLCRWYSTMDDRLSLLPQRSVQAGSQL